MIRKISSRAFFAAAVLAALTSINTQAAPILEFVPDDTTIGVGGSFSVDVFGSDFNDLFAYQGLIFYDPDLLSPTAITEGSFLSSVGATAFFGEALDGNALLIDILLDSTSGASGSGSLATLTFTGLAPGVSSLMFSDFFLLDSAGGVIEAETRNGRVTIPEPGTLALFTIGLLGLALSTRRIIRARGR